MAGESIELPGDGGASALLSVPFWPGSAPFKVKGNAYRGHLAYVAAEIPGGLDAHRRVLRFLHAEHGETWSRFFDQNFVTGGWYDTYPLAVAGIACAKITGQSFLDFVRQRTDWQARSDIRGLYKFLLKLVSAKSLAVRVPSMASQYFDFVQASSAIVDKNTVTGELAGIPVELAQWWATIAEAYVAAVLELAGNLRVSIEMGPYLDAGEAHGRALCTVHTRVALRGAFDPKRPIDNDLNT